MAYAGPLYHHPPTNWGASDRHLRSSTRTPCATILPLLSVPNGSTVALENGRVRRRCELFDLHEELVPYERAWSWQKSMVSKRQILIERDEDRCDALISLQHPPVYTLGTSSREEFLKFDPRNAQFEVFRTERGGEVTFHGPGQIVMYPILNLRYHKMDLHWYLRSLEEVIIRALWVAFSIKAGRVDGLTGVWVGNEKIAAIGIRVSRWLTYHGLALNVSTDLAPFADIVPCGIRDRGVGSLRRVLAVPPVSAAELDDSLLMDAAHASLLREFGEVFQLSLDPVPAPHLPGKDIIQAPEKAILSDPVNELHVRMRTIYPRRRFSGDQRRSMTPLECGVESLTRAMAGEGLDREALSLELTALFQERRVDTALGLTEEMEKRGLPSEDRDLAALLQPSNRSCSLLQAQQYCL